MSFGDLSGFFYTFELITLSSPSTPRWISLESVCLGFNVYLSLTPTPPSFTGQQELTIHSPLEEERVYEDGNSKGERGSFLDRPNRVSLYLILPMKFSGKDVGLSRSDRGPGSSIFSKNFTSSLPIDSP